MGCGNSNGSIGSGGCALSPKVTYQAQKPAGCVVPFQANDPRQSLYGQGRPQTGTAVKGDPYRGYISARTPSFPRGNGRGPSPEGTIVPRNQSFPGIPTSPTRVSPLGGVGSSTPVQPLRPMQPGVNLYPSGTGSTSPIGTPSTPMYGGTPTGTSSPVGGSGTSGPSPVATPSSVAPGKTPVAFTGEGGTATSTAIPGIIPPGNGDKTKPPVVLSTFGTLPTGEGTKGPDGSLYGDPGVKAPDGSFYGEAGVKGPDGTYPGEYPTQNYVEPKYAEQPPPWQSDYVMPGTQGWQPEPSSIPAMPDKGGYQGSLDEAPPGYATDDNGELVLTGAPGDYNLGSRDEPTAMPLDSIPMDALNADNNLSPKGTVADDLMGSLARSSGIVRPGNMNIYKQPRLAPLPAQLYANDPRPMVRPGNAARTAGELWDTQAGCRTIPGAIWRPADSAGPAWCEVPRSACVQQGGTWYRDPDGSEGCEFSQTWVPRPVTQQVQQAANTAAPILAGITGGIAGILALMNGYNTIATAQATSDRADRQAAWEHEARMRLTELQGAAGIGTPAQQTAMQTIINDLQARLASAGSVSVSTNTLLLVGGGLAAALLLGGVLMFATRRR